MEAMQVEMLLCGHQLIKKELLLKEKSQIVKQNLTQTKMILCYVMFIVEAIGCQLILTKVIQSMLMIQDFKLALTLFLKQQMGKMEFIQLGDYFIQVQFFKMQKQNEKKPEKVELPSRLKLDGREVPEQPMFPMLTASGHPVLAALHILLKAAIVAIYLLLPFIIKPLTAMMIVIILSAVDFWIVKNVAGRLLVGLRWWVDFDEEGQELWRFQCKVNEKDVNGASQKIFWWTLLLFSIVWIALIIFNIVKLNITQITICVFCASMLIFNLYSYYRCSKAQAENVKKLAYQYGNEVAMQFMAGTIVSNLF